MKITLRKANRQMYIAALSANGGNRSKAARQLGISRRTLQRNLPKMGLAMRPTSRNQASPRPQWAKDIREERQRRRIAAMESQSGPLETDANAKVKDITLLTPPANKVERLDTNAVSGLKHRVEPTPLEQAQLDDPHQERISRQRKHDATQKMIIATLAANGGSHMKMATQLGISRVELMGLMLEGGVIWKGHFFDEPRPRPNWGNLVRHQQEFKQRERRKAIRDEVCDLWDEHRNTMDKLNVAIGKLLVEAS